MRRADGRATRPRDMEGSGPYPMARMDCGRPAGPMTGYAVIEPSYAAVRLRAKEDAHADASTPCARGGHGRLSDCRRLLNAIRDHAITHRDDAEPDPISHRDDARESVAGGHDDAREPVLDPIGHQEARSCGRLLPSRAGPLGYRRSPSSRTARASSDDGRYRRLRVAPRTRCSPVAPDGPAPGSQRPHAGPWRGYAASVPPRRHRLVTGRLAQRHLTAQGPWQTVRLEASSGPQQTSRADTSGRQPTVSAVASTSPAARPPRRRRPERRP